MAQRLDVQYIQYYTEGNAARKVAPEVQPFKTLRLPKLRKKKVTVLRIDPIAVLGIVVSALMLVLLAVGVVKFAGASREAAALQSYVRELEAENARLEEDFHKALDLEDVLRTADALGLVPVEQVEHITLELPRENAPVTPWERLFTFLTGLFA